MPPPPANSVPTANAGVAQTVTSGVTVTLNGTASSDSNGSIASYAWTQTAGAAITLTGATSAQPTFSAPLVATSTVFTFSLIVTDNLGAPSTNSATVNITVGPPVAGNVNVTGRITFERIPTSANGLNYAAGVQQPARGVIVGAVNPASPNVPLATTTTDANGNYTLSVVGNTSINVVVSAQMLRDNTVPLPRWDFRAQDLDAGVPEPYRYNDGVAFNSSAGTPHNIAIPSGFNSSGTVVGTRASAPFAILDTVYQGVQTILAVAPTTNFPALTLDWAIDNPGGDTFFSTTDDNNQPLQRIVLSADPTEDTDEFDQHVIAHEFGHYIEFNFSRADNIGGSHGLGDKLDIRVAFGEGFGYAFAAIVLNDPVARDTFVDATLVRCGSLRCSSTFNVETNPATSPPGTPNGNFGCWCSESSVWSILWDLYDNAADANDNVALGFAPLWNVLVNEQRTTPALTSIFSFISALKGAQPASAANIDTLIAAQNITGTGMDAFGSTETHVPTPVFSTAALPIYTTIASSGMSATVLSVDDAGHYNTLGNHRFVRFQKNAVGNLAVSVTSAGTDPDAYVYRNGILILASEGAANENFTISGTGTFVFDVYECANGCFTVQGTPGDYNVTVTIN